MKESEDRAGELVIILVRSYREIQGRCRGDMGSEDRAGELVIILAGYQHQP